MPGRRAVRRTRSKRKSRKTRTAYGTHQHPTNFWQRFIPTHFFDFLCIASAWLVALAGCQDAECHCELSHPLLSLARRAGRGTTWRFVSFCIVSNIQPCLFWSDPALHIIHTSCTHICGHSESHTESEHVRTTWFLDMSWDLYLTW